MSYSARILADSISPAGVRLITFEVTFPRIVLAEFNTHRMFSRNSASSRAIPVQKMIKMVMENPYIPEAFGSNKKGMQAGEALTGEAAEKARDAWLFGRDQAVHTAELLLGQGVHKQLTNRLLEPFMWHTVIVTATEWDNFFHLRDNGMAHPGIAIPAKMMRELYDSNEPSRIDYGRWHTPLWPMQGDVQDPATGEDRKVPSVDDQIKISVGRCARVSYLTHDGIRDQQADIELHDRLLEAGHMSPFEHVARPMFYNGEASPWYAYGDEMSVCNGEADVEVDLDHMWSGNLRGWVSYRKTIPHESDILGHHAQTEQNT